LDHQWRAAGAAALMTAGLVLTGCSGIGISNPIPAVTSRLPSWFSSSSTTAATPAAAPAAEPMDEDCPVADVRRGASTLQVANKTENATANDLRYQFTIIELARQCTRIGTTVRMRVGVQGRVIVGPAGAPSEVGVPLRYAVIREGIAPKTIVTKFRRVPVSLPPGTDNSLFTDIEEDLSFPMPSQAELQYYVVYVGFDEAGDREAARPVAKRGRKR
jgi:hypothetical protein